MPNQSPDTRFAKLRDIPTLRRIADQGTVLDSELSYTRDAGTPNSTVLSGIVLPHGGLSTLITRMNNESVAGQFRLKSSDHLAQLVYIAPQLADQNDTPWLHLLDAIAAEVGKRGAHMLSAEVDESSQLFITMRQAGFAVYARQEIFALVTDGDFAHVMPAHLTEEADSDAMDIQLLYSNIVPRLVQQIAVPSSESTGYVYRQGERILGYIAISEGKYGVYLLPYLHPDVLFHEASAILAGAISRATGAIKQPVFVCVRRYQDWLEEALLELGFESHSRQAVMVRHITAGVRQADFKPLPRQLDNPVPVRPPTSQAETEPLTKPVNRSGE